MLSFFAPLQENKLDSKSTTCVFIGYAPSQRGYLCLEKPLIKSTQANMTYLLKLFLLFCLNIVLIANAQPLVFIPIQFNSRDQSTPLIQYLPFSQSFPTLHAQSLTVSPAQSLPSNHLSSYDKAICQALSPSKSMHLLPSNLYPMQTREKYGFISKRVFITSNEILGNLSIGQKLVNIKNGRIP